MTDIEWARAIIVAITGTADDPTPTLMKMIADIRSEGRQEGRIEEYTLMLRVIEANNPNNLGKA